MCWTPAVVMMLSRFSSAEVSGEPALDISAALIVTAASGASQLVNLCLFKPLRGALADDLTAIRRLCQQNTPIVAPAQSELQEPSERPPVQSIVSTRQLNMRPGPCS